MTQFDSTREITVPFSLEDTFDALRKAIPKISNFKIDRIDEITKTVHIKARVNAISLYDNMSVSLSQMQNGGTGISILSVPNAANTMMSGGIGTSGQNRRYIDKITQTLSSELKNYQQVVLGQQTAPPSVNIEEEIRKIKRLLDDGIITQGEFDAKKKQLLDL